MSRGIGYSGGDPFYAHAMMQANRQAAQIVYDGVNQTTRKWETVTTYGGKLAENVTQHSTFRPVPRVNRAEDRAHFLAADKFLPDAD